MNIPPALATVIVILTVAVVGALAGLLCGALIRMHRPVQQPDKWSDWTNWLSVFIIVAVVLLYFALMKVYDVSPPDQPVFRPSVLRVDV